MEKQRAKAADAIRSSAKRAAEAFPINNEVGEHTDDYLELVADDVLRSIAHLFEEGSTSSIYISQSSIAGWDASADNIFKAAHAESTNSLTAFSKKPVLVTTSEVQIKRADLVPHMNVTVNIISPTLLDITYIEKYMHTILSSNDIIGFNLHKTNGGSSAIQKPGFLYMLAILVIPRPSTIGLQVGATFSKVFCAVIKSKKYLSCKFTLFISFRTMIT